MSDIVKRLAEQACNETQQKMIMEFKTFEAQLYQRFAELIVEKCVSTIHQLRIRVDEDGVPAGYCKPSYLLGTGDAISEIEDVFEIDIEYKQYGL